MKSVSAAASAAIARHTANVQQQHHRNFLGTKNPGLGPVPKVVNFAQSLCPPPALLNRSLACSDMIFRASESSALFRRRGAKPHALSSMSYSVRRFHKKVLTPNELGSMNLLDIKKFLRWKAIDFKESHACLVVDVPTHLMVGESPPSQWKRMDQATVKVYVNKTTGLVVCPELALSDEWSKMRSFLEIWHKNRHRKKGEPVLEYPSLNALPIELPAETAEYWKQCLPIESLTTQEFKAALKNLRLPLKDYKLEDLVKFEARVSPGHDELLFPVRYVDEKSSVVGLRRLWMCPETRLLIEDNLPETSFEVNANRIFPFPHGLDHAAKSGSSKVLLVTSILDSIVIASRSPKERAVALAEGSVFLPPDHLPFFEGYERINFWFPRDVSAFESVGAFARKLGDKRCFTVSRDVDHPSACLKVTEKRTIPGILGQSMKPVAYEHITSFDSLRSNVFLEMAHFEEVEGWFDLYLLIRKLELIEVIFQAQNGSGLTC